MLLSTLATTALAGHQLTLQSPSQATHAIDGPCSFKHYAALGDSYSVGLRALQGQHLPVCNGYNGPYCTKEHCAKNYGAYAWQFFQQYKPQYFDWLACSGANSTNCIQDQVPLLNSSTDLMTITIGGDNGKAFARVVGNCVYGLEYYPKRADCTVALQNATEVLSTIKPAINETLYALKNAAPLAKIILLSDIQLWSATISEDFCYGTLGLVPAATKIQMKSLLTQFSGNVSDAVNEFNVANSGIPGSIDATFVDVDPYFEGHRLCDETPFLQWNILSNVSEPRPWEVDNLSVTWDPLVDFWPLTGVFHPNYLGQQAYLQALSDSLKCPS